MCAAFVVWKRIWKGLTDCNMVWRRYGWNLGGWPGSNFSPRFQSSLPFSSSVEDWSQGTNARWSVVLSWIGHKTGMLGGETLEWLMTAALIETMKACATWRWREARFGLHSTVFLLRDTFINHHYEHRRWWDNHVNWLELSRSWMKSMKRK